METNFTRYIKLVQDFLQLSYDDAVDYATERSYNEKSHSEAMSTINTNKGETK